MVHFVFLTDLNFLIKVWPFLSSFDDLWTHCLKKHNLNKLTLVLLKLSSSQTGFLKEDYFKIRDKDLLSF